MTPTPKSLKRPEQILGSSTVLKQLYSHAQELLALQSAVRRFVQAEISVASFDNQILHLVTPSGATATQLRYRQRNIISTVRKQLHVDVNSIRVSVRPLEVAHPTKGKAPIPISAANARQLANTAKYIEDEGLRKALVTLSRRGKGD